MCSGGDDGTVRIWAPKSGSCKHVFEGHFGHSDDGDLLLSGSGDGTVKLYQISGKKVLQKFQHSQPDIIQINNNNKLTTISENNDNNNDDYNNNNNNNDNNNDDDDDDDDNSDKIII